MEYLRCELVQVTQLVRVQATRTSTSNSYEYKQLSSDLLVNGSDGSIIVKGLVKTVYLQCGDPEELRADGLETVQRFYTTLADWQAANPEPKEAPKPLGAIIET